MKVLAIGAAGVFAGLVPVALKDRGISVRAFVRSREQEVSLRTKGYEDIAIGDLRDVASLDSAMQDVDGVFHIGPSFLKDEAQVGLNVVNAAERAGVRRFVFSSVIQPTITRLSNHASKIPVEDALYASRMEYVVLQPANFFQNIGKTWPDIVKTGVFSEPFPRTARIAHVDFRDVADVVSIAFSENSLNYGTFELCAGLFNRVEIAAVMSEVLGQVISAEESSVSGWNAAINDEQTDAMKAIFTYYSHSPMGGNSLVLKSVLGREPLGIRSYIESLVAH